MRSLEDLSRRKIKLDPVKRRRKLEHRCICDCDDDDVVDGDNHDFDIDR